MVRLQYSSRFKCTILNIELVRDNRFTYEVKDVGNSLHDAHQIQSCQNSFPLVPQVHILCIRHDIASGQSFHFKQLLSFQEFDKEIEATLGYI